MEVNGQIDLFKDVAAARRFEKYHAENPVVYKEFCFWATALINAGAKRIGGKLIAERIRFDSVIRGNDGFKINNSYVSFYVRMFQKEYPKYADRFETRNAVADLGLS